ncbi:hypothetical protein AB1Y20_011735 [Prymnesium parvum]|uniref:protein-ribulosamine 3-kinase n=1 Tax=Prymnesium parvum TaxID=97485 RepID=A0AB34IHY2_PRYPA
MFLALPSLLASFLPSVLPSFFPFILPARGNAPDPSPRSAPSIPRPLTPRLAGPPKLSSASLSDPIIAAISRCGYGRVRRVTDVTPPGTRSTHMRYDTDEGPVFCKRSPLPLEVLSAEATSLRVMGSAALAGGYLRVPAALGCGSLPFGGSYLLLEWVEPSRVLGLLPSTQEELGCGLAALHSAPQPPPRRGFGFECDTHLDGLRQDNRWMDTYADFFVARRLKPQLSALASRVGSEPSLHRLADPVLSAADVLLRELADPPALLHGDLWMGSVGANSAQQPVLYRGACWYGLPEFDLAAGSVYGSLGASFYRAYHAQRPQAPGFEERQDLFCLYHILNHLNLEATGSGHRGAKLTRREYSEKALELMKRIAAAGQR